MRMGWLRRRRTAAGALALLLAAGCAGGAASRRPFPAAEDPRPAEVKSRAERRALRAALAHLDRAEEARLAGRAEAATAEWKAAADALDAAVERFPGARWRLAARRVAAERYLGAGEPEDAAGAAEAILDDREADPASRAYAARLAAGAYKDLALAEVQSGKLEPLRLVPFDEREGSGVPQPRQPPAAWARFVAAADRWLERLGDDPDAKRAADDPRAVSGYASQLAVLAAQVAYAHDDLDGAKRRLDRILENWPESADALEAAVPLYLQILLVKREGEDTYGAAVARLRETVAAEARRARDAAAGAAGSEPARRRAESLGRLEEQLEREQRGLQFVAAMRLLDAGRPAEAAGAFERFAEEARTHPDAALALHNASVAFDRAGEPARADAVRETLLERYPQARFAPLALLSLASSSQRARDHARAEKLYGEYLERWPRGEQRCNALRNAGYAAEALSRPGDAAGRYLALGTDPGCRREDPNGVARVLHRAGTLFGEASDPAGARAAFDSLAALQGVTDAEARALAEDARKRVAAERGRRPARAKGTRGR